MFESDTAVPGSGSASIRSGFGRRNAAVLVTAVLGLALFVFLLISGSAGSTAQAQEPGFKGIEAKVLTDHECDSTEWHFVITQVSSAAAAPANITVTWANGQTATVPLSKFTGGVAHYTTTLNLDSAVVSATADIYEGWSGQFNLSHGPCVTPSPSPSAPSTS